jgi:hypothetical protein
MLILTQLLSETCLFPDLPQLICYSILWDGNWFDMSKKEQPFESNLTYPNVQDFGLGIHQFLKVGEGSAKMGAYDFSGFAAAVSKHD